MALRKPWKMEEGEMRREGVGMRAKESQKTCQQTDSWTSVEAEEKEGVTVYHPFQSEG